MFAIFFLLSLLIPQLAQAASESTSSAQIQATVPDNQGPLEGDTTAPTPPILLRPTDGTYTSHSRPEFVWLQAKDPNSNYLSYDLYLSNVATFLGINNFGNTLTHNYTARLEDGSLRLLPINNLLDGSYDWQVIAYDLSGNQRGSARWHFVIDTIPPKIVVTNINNTNISPILYDETITVPSGETYITVSSDPYARFSLVILSSDMEVIHSQSVPSIENGIYTFKLDLKEGLYQMIISATDLAGNTTLHPSWNLNVTSQLKPKDPIITPAKSPLPTTTFSPLTSLPATILQTVTRYRPANIYLYLIAIVTILLLISRRKYNLQITNAENNQPTSDVSIVHNNKHTYTTNKQGKVFIKDLRVGSTLQINNTHYLTIYRQDNKFTHLKLSEL